MEDPLSARFTWTIDSFSKINTKKLYSDIFCVGGYKWRILIFPKGNSVDYLSMYLDVADSSTLPNGWSRNAQFSLSIVNQIHSKYSIRKETQHQFNAPESDWGFTSFMPLCDFYDPARGFLVNDSCIVEADVAVRTVVDSYDSKKETGFVGLKNQGATAYMNSLLQTLYHIPHFRKAMYHMPTTENDNPSSSITLALQSLFYRLELSDTTVATKELTKSFGWETSDSLILHDVHELNRVLCEKLENKMKGTVVEGTIQQLFEGHHMSYIECINVDYKSPRKESFKDLQLDVKGCRDVYASFDKYVEVEHLEGDNMYRTEQHGLQDAKKGVLFLDFPPVLQLHLKRFEYDFVQDTTVKINDRYEFPLQLDLDREERKYLSADADRSIRNLYTLHSVLVHSGEVHSGHYYAYIRPTLSDQWFKFDDDLVTKEDMKRALEEQYGDEEKLPLTSAGLNNSPSKFTKWSSAYILVYIRESDKEKIICNIDEDIAEHVRVRLKEEKKLKRKEIAEAHLYTIIKVARNEDLLEQIGKNIYFDLVDHDRVRKFRIQKQIPFNLFKEEIAKEFGVPVQFQRFWLWAKRQNHTYRPHRPLTPFQEAESVGQLREVNKKADNAELNLFLEVELGLNLRPIAPSEKTEAEILLFFKLYDPVKEELRYIGRLFVKQSGKPIEILTELNEMAGFSADEQIELFEEIKFKPTVMCEHIDNNTSFHLSQFEDGDIICFQKSPQAGSSEKCRYPDVPAFLESVCNRQSIVGISINLIPEKSAPLPSSLAIAEKSSDQVTPLAKDIVNPQVGTPVTFSTESSPQLKEPTLMANNTREGTETACPPAHQVVAEADSSSFAKFDAMFAGIQNLLEGKTSEAESSDSFQSPLLSTDEISNAKRTFKQCLGQNLTNVIKLGWTQEIMNSLSVMLTANAIPINLVEELSWFLFNFDQSCERYMAAKQDIVEVEGKENSVGDLKTNLKQLYHRFMPIRNEASSVDEEIAELERQLTEKKAKKAMLQSSLEDLTRQAATSRQTVINAELDMKLNRLRKKQAEKTVVDMERSWESLKAHSSPFVWN